MWFSDGWFSVGLAGPLALLFLGFLAIGLLFSGASIVVRQRADYELTAGKSQRKIDWAIAILVVSNLLSILGGYLYHNSSAETGAGMMLFIFAIFLLWPVSAILTLRGRGAGRKVLLVGHGLIALLISVVLLSVIRLFGH
jgi:hypothetical protein